MSDIAPAFEPIQQQSLQFNSPASEAAMTAMGAAINGLLSIMNPLGAVIMAAVDEPTFQSQLGSPSPPTWVLADGRNVAGSAYQELTGNTTIPDLRATYPRGTDNGNSSAGARGLDPNGNQAPGTYFADTFAAHNHTYQAPNGGSGGGSASGTTGQAPTTNTSTVGGNETRPKTTYVNFFIRIN